MRLAKVIGTVVATIKHPSIKNSRMLLIQQFDDDMNPVGDSVVALDTVSAAPGQLVYVTLSRESAFALPNNFAPVDIAITGIVDEVNQETNEIYGTDKIFGKE